MRTPSGWILTAALLCGAAAQASAAPAPSKPTPTPGPTAPQGPPLSAADKAQARKVLAAVVAKWQSSRGKLAPAKASSAAGFHAHRCAVLHDQSVGGKERAANGPFRTTCSDWVSRPKKELAIKDGEQPCTTTLYGPGLAGCTSWVDQWDTGRGKWVEIWRQSIP